MEARRSSWLLGAVLLSAASAGFLRGVSTSPEPRGYVADTQAKAREGKPASSYRELRTEPHGPNAAVYSAARGVLTGLLPSRTDAVPPRTEEARLASLAKRASRRAFDGAPPTIPHAIDERTQPNCLVCHERGAKVGDRIAPMMGHRPLSSCTQCHAPSAAARPAWLREALEQLPAAPEETTLTARATVEEFGGRGARAYPHAPPALPHTRFMRERCESCHGVTGSVGLRTSHPVRQSCQQCHLPRSDFAREAMLSTLAKPSAEVSP